MRPEKPVNPFEHLLTDAGKECMRKAVNGLNIRKCQGDGFSGSGLEYDYLVEDFLNCTHDELIRVHDLYRDN